MTDLISRQAAIEHLKKRLYETALNNDTEHPYYEEMADNRVSVWLEEVPTIDPVKRGKWKCFIEIESGLYDSIDIPRAECSECGFKVPEEWGGWFKFCPNCGARMDGEE